MQVDGRSRMEGPVTITAEFARVPGDPITSLFETWGVYPEYVFEGYMDPYIDLILCKEIDYNIRMFVFNFDWSGVKIIRSGSTLPGIIMVSGDGAPFDFDRASTTFTEVPTVSFPMKFPAVVQNDPAILTDFNEIVSTFHSKMNYASVGSAMKKVSYSYRGYFKGYLYPWINLPNSVLETYVEPPIFNLMGDELIKHKVIKSKSDLSH